MASYDVSPACQFWVAVERPAIVNRVAYYSDLVSNPPRDLSMCQGLRLNFRLFNSRKADKARAHLVLGDRRHELLRLTQTARVLAGTLPLALEVASELWLAELETVAAQYAALGPIGADPDPGPFIDGLRVFGPFLPSYL
jgi:hypothetical protein